MPIGDVLDGIVLTHRIRASLGDRADLWLGHGVQPLLTMACFEALPLLTGGVARIGETLDPGLVGPPGWLPPADRGDLVALTWVGGPGAGVAAQRAPGPSPGGGSPRGHAAALDASRAAGPGAAARAERYGMTLDQFVIALLGHLGWMRGRWMGRGQSLASPPPGRSAAR